VDKVAPLAIDVPPYVSLKLNTREQHVTQRESLQ